MGEHQNQVATQPNGKPFVGDPNWRGTGEGHPMKVWRMAYGINLDDISFVTGISVASLSRIERYKQTPLIGAAQKIIAASGGRLVPDDFFGVQ
jgi:hypothetical protein